MKLIVSLVMVAGSTAFAVEAPKPVPFGMTADGTPVDVYTLTNAHGLRLRAMTYGGIVTSLEVPDRQGQLVDVVLGYDSLESYVKRSPYFGAVVGRYGNRIAKGRFGVGGREYSLALNNAPGGNKCALHGGIRGFDKVVWKGEGLVQDGAQGVRFTYLSKDGEEGYPGNLDVSVTYLLTNSNEWQVVYELRTDKATPVNVTQHSYFNLKGEGSGDILGHELKIVASNYTPVDAGLIPTGTLAPVSGTPFDFKSFQPIGARVNDHHEQLAFLETSPSRPASTSRKLVGRWTYGRPSREFSFTAATFWTAVSPARAAALTSSATASASRRSIFRTARTRKPSPRRCSSPGTRR